MNKMAAMPFHFLSFLIATPERLNLLMEALIKSPKLRNISFILKFITHSASSFNLFYEMTSKSNVLIII